MVNDVLPQSQVAGTTPTGLISNQFIQQTFNQMKVIAREARVTPADHNQLVSDEQAVMRDLGPSPDVNLGGSAPRDPLTVFLDSQAANFVHKR